MSTVSLNIQDDRTEVSITLIFALSIRLVLDIVWMFSSDSETWDVAVVSPAWLHQ
ncbi:MAG TPA: hypothetical protein ACQGQH_01615 [Xylella sp.]